MRPKKNVPQLMNSKRKGKRIEREAAAYLQKLGFPDARRTAQVRGKNDGWPDIDGVPGWWIEVKGDQKIALGNSHHRAAIYQAIRDSRAAASTDRPCVLWRRTRSPWCLTIPDHTGGHATYCGNRTIQDVLAGVECPSKS